MMNRYKGICIFHHMTNTNIFTRDMQITEIGKYEITWITEKNKVKIEIGIIKEI